MRFEFTQSAEAREYLISYGIEPASVINNWSDDTVVHYANHKHGILNKDPTGTLTLNQLHGLKDDEDEQHNRQSTTDNAS